VRSCGIQTSREAVGIERPPVTVPGSMYDGAAICSAAGAYRAPEVKNGSGRLLARGEARRTLGDEQHESTTRWAREAPPSRESPSKGRRNHRHVPLDEARTSTNDLDEVLACSGQRDSRGSARRFTQSRISRGG